MGNVRVASADCLLATTEYVAKAAGVTEKDATRRIISILLQTLANYASFGAAGAFSGPIVRGDVETVAVICACFERFPRLARSISRWRAPHCNIFR